MYFDETAALCQWHISEKHFLEMWSDARAYDGTVSIVQPLIEPLYDSKSIHEVVQLFLRKITIKKITTSLKNSGKNKVLQVRRKRRQLRQMPIQTAQHRKLSRIADDSGSIADSGGNTCTQLRQLRQLLKQRRNQLQHRQARTEHLQPSRILKIIGEKPSTTDLFQILRRRRKRFRSTRVL